MLWLILLESIQSMGSASSCNVVALSAIFSSSCQLLRLKVLFFLGLDCNSDDIIKQRKDYCEEWPFWWRLKSLGSTCRNRRQEIISKVLAEYLADCNNKWGNNCKNSPPGVHPEVSTNVLKEGSVLPHFLFVWLCLFTLFIFHFVLVNLFSLSHFAFSPLSLHVPIPV